jgi:hypothetical protein
MLVEAVRNGYMKHVSKCCHVYPTLCSKVMVIGVLLAYLGTADNGRKPPIKRISICEVRKIRGFI